MPRRFSGRGIKTNFRVLGGMFLFGFKVIKQEIYPVITNSFFSEIFNFNISENHKFSLILNLIFLKTKFLTE